MICIGWCRGFGFITFESRAGIDAVFAEDKVNNHMIDNRQVEVKIAMTQERQRVSGHSLWWAL